MWRKFFLRFNIASAYLIYFSILNIKCYEKLLYRWTFSLHNFINKYNLINAIIIYYCGRYQGL